MSNLTTQMRKYPSWRGFRWILYFGPAAYGDHIDMWHVRPQALHSNGGLVLADVVETFVQLHELRDGMNEKALVLIPRAIHWGYCAVDGVPWEIHAIEDRVAYKAALKAYRDEVR